MRFGRIVLAVSAVPFILTGLLFLVAPATPAGLVGLAIDGPSVDSMVRTAFGGLQVGCGAFLAIAAAKASWVRPGLVAQMALWGCPVVGRLVSWLATGSLPGRMLLLVVSESAFVVLGVVAWRRLGRSGG